MPSFHKEVLRNPPSLSTRGPPDTHVPSTTLDWQHSPSPPLGDVGHSLTTGHDRHRIPPSILTLTVSDTPVPPPSIK